MKMKFRSVQVLTVGTMMGYWAMRLATNPYHMHFSMLMMAVLAVGLSELGYRAGKKEFLDRVVKIKEISDR